jgi:hypothetical protein
MNSSRFNLTVEHALYLALFGLALALRLYQLGAHPLTEAEAREALSAFQALHNPGEAGAPTPHSPAYFFFTYLGFLVFDASDAIARLAPALFGAALVIVPLLFREELGRGAALITSGLLAVSAGMLAASRSADGSMIALFGLTFGLGALWQFLRTNSTPWLVGGTIALGVGLASGAAFVTGALIVIAALFILTWVSPEEKETVREAWARVRAHGEPAALPGAYARVPLLRWRTFFLVLILSVLVVATVGLVYLPGLGALVNSWLTWFSGFVPSPASRQPVTLLAFLAIYEPLVVVFGVVGAVRAFRDGYTLGQGLAWFSGLALAFGLFYGARSLYDALWIITPLSALAGWALADLLGEARDADRETWPMAGVQIGVIVALLGYAAINVAAFVEQVRINTQVALGPSLWQEWLLPNSPFRFLTLASVAILLTLVVSFLFSLGWSGRAARLGLALSAAGVLLASGVSAGWGLIQLRPNNPVELWWSAPDVVADDLHHLMETLSNVSNYSVGNEHDVEVTVQAPRDGALAWALRDFPHARFVDNLDAGINSPVVIAPEAQTNPTLGSGYVGQGFPLRESPSFDLSWPEWLGWLAFRRAPVQAEHVILWVRQDVQQLQGAGQ